MLKSIMFCSVSHVSAVFCTLHVRRLPRDLCERTLQRQRPPSHDVWFVGVVPRSVSAPCVPVSFTAAAATVVRTERK